MSVLDIPQEPVWAKRYTFDRVVATWAETLLIEFTASMCVYSKIIDPVVTGLAREKAGKPKVLKIDTDTDEYLTQRLKVEKTPTFYPVQEWHRALSGRWCTEGKNRSREVGP
jgi:thiol-disulfide isomerase/thioredoxin